MTAGGEHAFGEERRERIVLMVNTRGRVRIGELAREVAASEPTVRKDLALLERAGLLRRTHGGALALKPPAERPFADRLGRDAEAKTAIARVCVDLVADGDSIYLDSGTTTLRIAELLTARHVNALTNGIAVAAALAEKPTVRHTLVGGVGTRYCTLDAAPVPAEVDEAADNAPLPAASAVAEAAATTAAAAAAASPRAIAALASAWSLLTFLVMAHYSCRVTVSGT